MLEQLKTRITTELEEFKREILDGTTEDIYEKAYRISIVKDFEYLPFDELSDSQIETLMEQKNIIEFLWDEWMDSSGYNTFEVLDRFFKYVMEDRI